METIPAFMGPPSAKVKRILRDYAANKVNAGDTCPPGHKFGLPKNTSYRHIIQYLWTHDERAILFDHLEFVDAKREDYV